MNKTKSLSYLDIMNILKDSFRLSLKDMTNLSFDLKYSYFNVYCEHFSELINDCGFCSRFENIINACIVTDISINITMSDIDDLITNKVETVNHPLIKLFIKYRPKELVNDKYYYKYDRSGWRKRIMICNNIIKELKELNK